MYGLKPFCNVNIPLGLTAIAVGRKASFALLSPNDCLPTALRLHLNNPQGAKPLDPYNCSATFTE